MHSCLIENQNPLRWGKNSIFSLSPKLKAAPNNVIMECTKKKKKLTIFLSCRILSLHSAPLRIFNNQKNIKQHSSNTNGVKSFIHLRRNNIVTHKTWNFISTSSIHCFKNTSLPPQKLEFLHYKKPAQILKLSWTRIRFQTQLFDSISYQSRSSVLTQKHGTPVLGTHVHDPNHSSLIRWPVMCCAQL